MEIVTTSTCTSAWKDIDFDWFENALWSWIGLAVLVVIMIQMIVFTSPITFLFGFVQ